MEKTSHLDVERAIYTLACKVISEDANTIEFHAIFDEFEIVANVEIILKEVSDE